jgi:hypothetical protein
VFRVLFLECFLVLIGCGKCFSQGALPSFATRVPVLAELFTSEGCSTCPPADVFVQALDTQPVPGIEIIVLSEHVDYWNQQGWTDPYSSSEISERQRAYAQRFKLADVYTPQLVIDGYRQMAGSSAREADLALRDARNQNKTTLRITDAISERGRVRAHVESDRFNPEKESRSLDVYVAVALNRAEGQVTKGENANRHLTHTAVMRKLTRIGKLKAGERFARDIDLKIDSNIDPNNLRVIAFLQDPDSWRIYGVGMSLVTATQHTDAKTFTPAVNH